MRDLKALIEKYKKEYNLEKPASFIEGHVIKRALKCVTGDGQVKTLGVDDEVVLEWILESEKEALEASLTDNVIAEIVSVHAKKKKDENQIKKGEDYEQINLFEL